MRADWHGTLPLRRFWRRAVQPPLRERGGRHWEEEGAQQQLLGRQLCAGCAASAPVACLDQPADPGGLGQLSPKARREPRRRNRLRGSRPSRKYGLRRAILTRAADLARQGGGVIIMDANDDCAAGICSKSLC